MAGRIGALGAGRDRPLACPGDETMMREIALVMVLLAAAAAPVAAQQTAAQPTPDFRGPPFAMQGGEAVYSGVCQGCHMADAKGAVGAGAYPALASNSRLESAGYVLTMVMNGHRGMPPFKGHFTNLQIA